MADSCCRCTNCDEGFEQYCEHDFAQIADSPDRRTDGVISSAPVLAETVRRRLLRVGYEP